MYKSFYTLIIGFSFLFCWDAKALAWKDAVQLAIENNQTLRSSEQEQSIAGYQVTIAKSPLFPAITLLGNWNEFVDQDKTAEHRAFIGPRLEYVVYQGGKINSGIQIAREVQKQVDLGVTLIRIDINSKLRQAFSNVIYAKNALSLARKIEDQRLENVKFTKIRYQSGLEFKWVFSSSQVKWENAKTDTEAILLEQISVLKDLERITGPLPVQSVDQVSEDGFYTDDNSTSPDQAFANIDNHPQILLQKRKVEESQTRIAFAAADQYPAFTFRGDTFLSSVRREDLFPYLSAGVFLNMPIFEGFKNKRSVDIAKAQYQQSQFDLTQRKLDLVSTIQKSYQTYLVSKKRLEVSKNNLVASEDRAKVVSQQYKSGLTNFLDWERSQDDWVSAEKELLEAARTYQQSRARYEEVLGTELSL